MYFKYLYICIYIKILNILSTGSPCKKNVVILTGEVVKL